MVSFAKSKNMKHFFIYDHVFISRPNSNNNSNTIDHKAAPETFEKGPDMTYMLDHILDGGTSTLLSGGSRSQSSIEACVSRLFALATAKHHCEPSGDASSSPQCGGMRMSISCVDVLDGVEVVDLLDTGGSNTQKVRSFANGTNRWAGSLLMRLPDSYSCRRSFSIQPKLYIETFEIHINSSQNMYKSWLNQCDYSVIFFKEISIEC
jgi:hypothetical protein